MKATAIAPSNIAFIKYWGKKNQVLKLPENGSIAMTLSGLATETTVEFSDSYTLDEITINETKEPKEGNKAIEHLDRIRIITSIHTKAKVVTRNNFPTGTGLSSSASGFAALTMAATVAAGLKLSEKELSIIARQGSGSACRSIPSGFIEWLGGDTSDTSYAVSLYPPEYWDIVDIVVLVSSARKDVSSSEGQKSTGSSPFFRARLAHMKQRIDELKSALSKKDFTKLGEISEAEALELHAIMLTSAPSLIYWTPGTLEIMKLVKVWRKEGLECYFTINTGQDVHVLVEQKNADVLRRKLQSIKSVRDTIVNHACEGAHITQTHLF